MLDISQLLKGTTPQLVLAALMKKEKYGYEIIKDIRDASEEVIQLGEGSVYPLLHALEQKGLVKSRWVQQEKGPGRKYYKLTPKGIKSLGEAKTQWKTFEQAVQRVLSGSAA